MASKARAQANLLGSDGKIKATQFGNDTLTSDMLAPNLELTGDYVKVPVGTTAERPGSPEVGHLRFNTTFGRLEQYVTDGWRAVDTPPTVTSLAYSGGLLAADPAGGETVTITGTNFQSGATVTFGDTSAASVTVNSSTSITATTPAKTAGDYDVKVTNSNGLSATLENGIAYNGVPSFSTAAGKIGDSLAPNTTISTITIVASEPDSGTLSYSITSGAVPSGLTFDSDGTIVGTTPDGGAADTTYNFTVTATDDENQTNSRAFNLVVLRNIYAYSIPQSLMFNDDDSQSLDFTPPGGGSNKVFTFSAWFKRSTIGTTQDIFHTGPDTSNQFNILFSGSTDQFLVIHETGDSDDMRLTTNAVFRDTSAWYHIVVAVNTTESTSSERVKIYVNGESASLASANYPSQNFNTRVNTTNKHRIGGRAYDSGYFDGYVTDIYLIDGLALAPTAFGESYAGLWVPKEYTGSFPNTSSWHLPMTNDTSVEAFNAVAWYGDGTVAKDINGVGFQPDFLWIKERTSGSSHKIIDVIRGVGVHLQSSENAAEASSSTLLKSFNSDGFTLGNDGGTNQDNQSYVAWCWKAGDSNASNDDGSVSSTIRANQTYGFSIVSYTGDGNNNATVGHGLNAAPDLIILKYRDSTSSWRVYHSGLTAGYNLFLNSSTAETQFAENGGYISSSDATTFTLTQSGVSALDFVNKSSAGYIAYCWDSTAGYSAFGTYEGNGSADGAEITLGWKPAMLIVKSIDASGNWRIVDNIRSTTNPRDIGLNANEAAQTDFTQNTANFTDTGFKIIDTGGANTNGETFVYMAFRDTLDSAFWRDESGNNNDWQPVNTGAYRITTDTPTE